MRILSIIMLIFMFITNVYAQADEAVYTEDKLAIQVSPKQPQFTIKLKSNPTTGYSWYLRNYHSKIIQPIKHTFQAGDSKLIGAPGYEIWIFRVKPAGFAVPQQTRIRFVYTRPWESSKQDQKLIFKVSTMGRG